MKISGQQLKKGKYSKIKFLHKLNAQTDCLLLVCLKFDQRFRFPNCKRKTDGSHLVKGQLEDLELLGLDSGARTSSLCPPWTVLPLVTLGRIVLRVPVDRTWAFSTIRSDKKKSQLVIMVVYGSSQNCCCRPRGANWGLISSVAQLRANFYYSAQFLPWANGG